MSLLDEKRKKYGIPAQPYGPKGKVCLVFRLPPEKVSAGGIIFAEAHQEQKQQGVLIAAGLAARDEMKDHLIEMGDTVYFGRFAGYDQEVERDPENQGKAISQLMISDIHGSVEAIEREKEHDLMWYEDDKEGFHYWEPKTDIKRKAKK